MDAAGDVERRIREWASGLWAPLVDQSRRSESDAARGGTVEERLRRIEDEREIEKAFRRYHNFYDGHDLEGIVSCFAEDAVQVNGRGTFIGRESIRRSYEYLIAHQRIIFHFGTNVLITLDPDDPDRALLSARHFDFWVSQAGAARCAAGVYLNRMRRGADGRWLIAEHRITFNLQYDVDLTARVLGTLTAPPDLPLSQVDLLEERHLLA